MPAPDQVKPTKSYVPIVCKINPNSSTGLRTTVYHKSYKKDTTHVMLKTAFKYSALFLCKDPLSESMLIPQNAILRQQCLTYIPYD